MIRLFRTIDAFREVISMSVDKPAKKLWSTYVEDDIIDIQAFLSVLLSTHYCLLLRDAQVITILE